jgi:hypothetical protein
VTNTKRKAKSAGVVESVDTRDLKSLGFGHAGSSPAARTTLRSLSFGWRATLSSDLSSVALAQEEALA